MMDTTSNPKPDTTSSTTEDVRRVPVSSDYEEIKLVYAPRME